MPAPSQYSRAEFTFSFLSHKLTAKGMVAYVLAFAVTAVLLAMAWRIATSDFTGLHTALSKGLFSASSVLKNE